MIGTHKIPCVQIKIFVETFIDFGALLTLKGWTHDHSFLALMPIT